MPIEIEQVRHVARLARLAVTDEASAVFARELTGILDMVDEMSATDTTGVAPMANPFDAVQRLRSDAVTEPDRRETLQANAPATENGLYLVPRVID